MINVHRLSLKDRTITFVIDKTTAQAVVKDDRREATCTIVEARAFYRSLLRKGWTDPVVETEAMEREMQRIEAKGDRMQTRRDEMNKMCARMIMEG